MSRGSRRRSTQPLGADRQRRGVARSTGGPGGARRPSRSPQRRLVAPSTRSRAPRPPRGATPRATWSRGSVRQPGERLPRPGSPRPVGVAHSSSRRSAADRRRTTHGSRCAVALDRRPAQPPELEVARARRTARCRPARRRPGRAAWRAGCRRAPVSGSASVARPVSASKAPRSTRTVPGRATEVSREAMLTVGPKTSPSRRGDVAVRDPGADPREVVLVVLARAR